MSLKEPVLTQQELEWIKNTLSSLGDKDPIIDISPLSGGLNNQIFLLKTQNDAYVFRIPKKRRTKNLLGHNYSQELAAEKRAASLGLNKSFRALDTHSGFKLSHYLGGARPLTCLQTADLERLACALATIHSQEVSGFSSHFDPVKLLWELLEVYGQSYDWSSSCTKVLDTFEQCGSELCFCHNDFYPANILKDQDGSISIIDWELAGISYSYFDLGNFLASSKLETDKKSFFVKSYYKWQGLKAKNSLSFSDFTHVVNCVEYLSAALWILWAKSTGEPEERFKPWIDRWREKL